jgi:hypothetical protein|tara:strand:- start:9 stop:416 length:408 start_codon:yes stop_codon:yes gene_type:complete
MKLELLRKVIREEVKAAMKEELQEIMNEAVKVASKPSGKEITYQNTEINKNKSSITEMLNMTKSSMNNDEYRNVLNMNSDMVKKPNFASSMASSMGMSPGGTQPGLDISQFDFVKKASAVYNKSIEKDKNRNGVI